MSTADWKRWKGGNPNHERPEESRRVLGNLRESAVPPGTDPREAATYEAKTLTGNKDHDMKLQKLVGLYNTIGKLRRSCISRLSRQPNKRQDADLDGDIKHIEDLTLKAKNNYQELEEENVNPPKVPSVFDTEVKAPVIGKKTRKKTH